MKVSITEESKKVITLDELPLVQEIIDAEEEDTMTASEAAKMAVNASASIHGHGECVKVLEASAGIAKNCRIRNFYHDASLDYDIWIDAIAQTENGFCVIGAYYSDINEIACTNRKEIASRMYVRWFKEAV